MKTLRALRTLATLYTHPHAPNFTSPTFLLHPYLAQPQEDSDPNDSDFVFNSVNYAIATAVSPLAIVDESAPRQPTWSDKYRRRADKVLFGDKAMRVLEVKEEEEVEEEKWRMLAKALLEAVLASPDDEDHDEEMAVREEDQKSLAVGIIGSPKKEKEKNQKNI